MSESNKVGRPTMGKRAMSGVEKNRRMLARRKLLNETAKEYGYTPTIVYLNDKQLLALKELEESWGSELDNIKLNHALFRELKYALEHSTSDLKAVKQDDWPQHSDIDMIYINGNLKFEQWEKEQ